MLSVEVCSFQAKRNANKISDPEKEGCGRGNSRQKYTQKTGRNSGYFFFNWESLNLNGKFRLK